VGVITYSEIEAGLGSKSVTLNGPCDGFGLGWEVQSRSLLL